MKNADHQATWRQAHVNENRKRNQASYQKRKLRNRRWVLDYLKRHHCVGCGENDILVLGFEYGDHEAADVANPISSFGLVRLKAEIEKCDVVCANCHQRWQAYKHRWY